MHWPDRALANPMLLIAAFVLSAGALCIVYRSRHVITCLPPGHKALLLDRSYRLGLLFLLSGVLASLAVGIWTGNIRETTIGYSIRSMKLRAASDSWHPMQIAIEQLREHPDDLVYAEIFFTNKRKFQYPLSALLFLDLPQKLSGLSWDQLVSAIDLFCWFCLPALGVVYCSLFTRAALRHDIAESVRLPIASLALLTLMSMATVGLFYPVTRSFILGQVQTPITLLAGLALLAWQRRRYGLAGLFLGLCCGIKPQWLVIIPWAIFRRQWIAAISGAVTAGILLALSIALYGMGNAIDYLSVLSFLSQHGESFFPNQSVNGLVNRFLFNGNNLNWVANAFPPFHPVVYWCTMGASVLILGTALFWRMHKEPSSVDLALIVLSLTIASPIAWEHHYGILLPIFAAVLPAAIYQRALGVWTTAYLWLAFLLISQRLDGMMAPLANTHWNVLQSYLFFGAAMVLLLLYRISYLQTVVSDTSEAERS